MSGDGQTVLVTGAAGCVGHLLTEELLARGYAGGEGPGPATAPRSGFEAPMVCQKHQRQPGGNSNQIEIAKMHDKHIGEHVSDGPQQGSQTGSSHQ